ncbi:MAG: hypothetical protein JW814_06955 [Candidatus Krumholzibacteriota bacterium]|nr:hypothetical protein [Candidatus Krumholzibacteriota bacterium]
MGKMLMFLCVGLLLVPNVTLAQEQIEAYGADYFTAPEQVGTVVTFVSMLEPPVGFDYPFTVDFANNEYTMYCQTSITNIASSMFAIDISYADAEFIIYEDPSGDGDYGTNPPNAVSPSSFQNGTVILVGTISNFLRTDDPFGFLPPVLVADCVFTGGTKLAELPAPDSWTMHGGLSSSPPPVGYRHTSTMKIFFTGVVGSDNTSWGEIKDLSGEK